MPSLATVYDQSQCSTSLMAMSSMGGLYEPHLFQGTIYKDDPSRKCYSLVVTVI